MALNPSYRDITVNTIPTSDHVSDNPMEEGSLESDLDNLEDDLVQLLIADQNCLYSPWKFSMILKAFGSKFTQQYLKTKLEALWQLPEPLCLVDLGYKFFTTKFHNLKSQSHIIQGGPWFITDNFISVRQLEPNFFPTQPKLITL